MPGFDVAYIVWVEYLGEEPKVGKHSLLKGSELHLQWVQHMEFSEMINGMACILALHLCKK